MRVKTSMLLSSIAATLIAGESIYTLDSLSVTALRESENIQSQPLSIDVKNIDEISLDQVIFQKDLLNSISGVRIEQTGSIIGHKTSIRMPMGTDPYYLFLQDGIPVQSSGFFNHNGLAYTTYGSASSAEVLKGTGTALYGSDAMAGTINVIGAAEPSKQLERTIGSEVGSDGYRSAKVGFSDTIDEKNAYRMNLRYDQSQGWRDHTEYNRLEANGRYDYVINNDNMVKIMVSGTKSDAEQADDFSDYNNIENGSTAASDDPAYFTALTKTDIRRQFDYARIAAEFTNYAFNDAEITITPYVRYNRNRYVATWEKNLPSNDSTQQSIGLMEKTKFTPSWGRVIAGFDTEYTQGDQKTNQDFDTTVGVKVFNTGSLYDYSVDYFALAPYLHADYVLTQKLTLSAGLRYDYNHYDYANHLAVGNDPSNTYYRSADRTDSFNHLSPKASIAYQALENLNIYARYANGFRIPQSTMLYSLKSGFETFKLDPETSDTYEIGMKIGNKKNYLEAAGYYMSVENTFTQYGTSPSKYYANGGESIHKGIEISGSSQLCEEVEVKAAYSYSKHTYNNNISYGDNEMAAAPNHTANARLFYSPEGIRGLTLMGEWQYIGSYWMDDDNTMKYNGYSIGNVKTEYKLNDGFTLFAKMTNISDKRYATSASKGWGIDYTPGDPRQLYAGMSYTW